MPMGTRIRRRQQVVDTLAAERLDALPVLRTVVRERRPQLFKDIQQPGLLPIDWQRLFGLEHVLVVTAAQPDQSDWPDGVGL